VISFVHILLWSTKIDSTSSFHSNYFSSRTISLHIRFHYPASKYHIDVYPSKGKVQEELVKINGGEFFSATANDPIIFVR